MSFNTKILLISALIFFSAPFIGYYYYKQTRPVYVPVQVEPRKEIDVTVIPGWGLRQIAADWVEKGIIKDKEELYDLIGKPAYNYRAVGEKAPVLKLANDSRWIDLFSDKPDYVSYEGYLFPDTYRVYVDATVDNILEKIFSNLNKKITIPMRQEIKNQKKTFYEVLTMASIVQKETPTKKEMSMVADIFWRRNNQNWALQSCATVNYITGKNDPGVTLKDRKTDSLFNTYEYPGLPLGAISNPGLNAIQATIYPEKNNYWYFMSGTDGETRWAKDLAGHNNNVYKYLR